MLRLRGKAVGGPGRPLDPDAARQALALLATPDGACQLQEIPTGRRKVLPWSDLDGLVRAAQDLAGGQWLYVTLNPVPLALDRSARKDDILRRRWLTVDVDPVRADSGQSATEEEHEAARLAAAQVR